MVELNYKIKHIRKHPTTRSGIKLIRQQAGVIHWTASFGGSAADHFKYFDIHLPDSNDNLPENKKRYASAHIFVDRHEALELVPLDEVCFHANDGGTPRLKLSTLRATSPQYPAGNANLLTIGIEMCVEKDKTIHPDTIKRTALVMQMLQGKFPALKDTYNRFVRHFDITSKPCPRPMVDNPAKFTELLDMAHGKIAINPTPKPVEQPKPEPIKEEPHMEEKAIIINSATDYGVAEYLSRILKAGIHPRKNAEEKQVAKEIYVIGGNVKGLKGDKFIVLSGANRLLTGNKVLEYINSI